MKRMAVGGAVLLLGLLMVGSAAAGASTDGQSGSDGQSGASVDHAAQPAQPEQAQGARQNQADHGGQPSPQAGDQAALDQPQPPSNADATGNGANTSGAYDSTRDGSPSGNGNGGGAAVGEPCAGCVGKADNKNPPGQFPDGTDANKGYECDANSGIGRTNPAHTGCTTQTTVTPTTVTPTTVTPTTLTPTTLLPTSVLGLSITRGAPDVAAAMLAAPAGTLPRTGSGSGLTVLALAGVALILLGALLLGHRPTAGASTA